MIITCRLLNKYSKERKNTMKKKLVMGILCSALAVGSAMAMTPPVMAASPVSGATQTTPVEYEVAETEWTWSVPATQTFTKDSLELPGTVKISPVGEGSVIALAEGTTIDVSINSANNFELKNTDNSTIPYQVKKGEDVLIQDAGVLSFAAGTSDNTGVEQALTFVTTLDNIKNAKLTGTHTDTITFTVNVSNS